MTDQPTTEIQTAKAEKSPLNAREKRSRILLIALAAIFGLLMVIQGPTLYNAVAGGGDSSGGSDTASAETDSNAAESVPAPDAGNVPATPSELSDSDLPQRAEAHELTKIDGFNAGDPFKAVVTPPAAAETTSSDNSSGSTSTSADPSNDAPSGDSEGSANTGSSESESTEPDESTTTSPNTGDGSPNGGSDVSNPDETNLPGARLSINDVSQDVSVNGTFPAANPVFVLSLVESTVVHVTLVDGAFSTGTESIAIELGETRTLVSQPDGVRYSVRYDEPIKK